MNSISLTARAYLTALVLCAIGLTSTVHAAPNQVSSESTITMTGLHCSSCSKKVKTKLEMVANVKVADVNHKTGVAKVTAKDGANPSPKLLWEAVEQADAKPTKLESPEGVFTSKPKK